MAAMTRITLRAVRLSYGYSPEEVAKYCAITVEEYKKFEENSKLLTVKVIRKLISIYKIPLSLIFMGYDERSKLTDY